MFRVVVFASSARARTAHRAMHSAALFCPTTHATLTRVLPTATTHAHAHNTAPAVLASAGVWTLGLSAFAQSRLVLGDVDEVVTDQHDVASLRVRWSGLAQSEGDELYHVRWDNVSGEHVIPLPASLALVPGSTSQEPDALCRLVGSVDGWLGLVGSESEYLAALATAAGDASSSNSSRSSSNE